MVKVVPKDEFCGLAHKDLIKIPSEKEINSLNLHDSYEPSIKEINRKFYLLKVAL